MLWHDIKIFYTFNEWIEKYIKYKKAEIRTDYLVDLINGSTKYMIGEPSTTSFKAN